MKHVVLDANVCLNWFLPSDKTDQIRYSKAFASYLKNEPVTVHVPLHFELEVLGPLLRSLRSTPAGISAPKFRAALNEMDALPLSFHELGLGFCKMSDLARAYNLSIYDTPYFNIARSFEFQLVTLDSGLVTAAKAWGVELWQPT